MERELAGSSATNSQVSSLRRDADEMGRECDQLKMELRTFREQHTYSGNCADEILRLERDLIRWKHNVSSSVASLAACFSCFCFEPVVLAACDIQFTTVFQFN